jgi:hypothetical protein
MYCNITWLQNSFEYWPKRKEVVESSRPSRVDHQMLTIIMLFRLFKPDRKLKKIVDETNHYMRTEDANGRQPDGPNWRNLSIQGLKAFFALSFYMVLKKQPNKKSYWAHGGSFFHYPIISQIFTRDHFQSITSCLHITNHANYV